MTNYSFSLLTLKRTFLLLANAGFTFLCSLLLFTLTNSFVAHLAEQEGVRPYDVRRDLKPAVLTLEKAQSLGFDTVDEYREALHEFLNSN